MGAARVQLVAVALQHLDVVAAVVLTRPLVLARLHVARRRLPDRLLQPLQLERQPVQRVAANETRKKKRKLN